MASIGWYLNMQPNDAQSWMKENDNDIDNDADDASKKESKSRFSSLLITG